MRSCGKRFVPVGTNGNGGRDPQKGVWRIAIYHCSIKIISRGKGKSAVTAAAYHAGETITNEYDGVNHDYTRKGGIVHTEILLPDNAPAEYADRATLWNAVEKIEKAKNSQLAREIEIALPVELTREQSISLVHEYVKAHFVAAGMCADFAIHDTGGVTPTLISCSPCAHLSKAASGVRSRKRNTYLTYRAIKSMTRNNGSTNANPSPPPIGTSRPKPKNGGAWADICNRALEHNDHAECIDHRSYERQGIDQIPPSI